MEDDFNSLFKTYLRKAKWANKNIERIEKKFGENSWATKKLKARLEHPLFNGWSTENRVSLEKPKDIKELYARLSALEKFEKSKTHTVTGINKVRKKVIKTIKEKLKDKGFKPTNEEIEALYEAFEDEDYQFFAQRVGESEFQAEIQDAREHHDTYEDFYNRLLQYFDESTIDDDYRDKLRRVYNKHILGEEY